MIVKNWYNEIIILLQKQLFPIENILIAIDSLKNQLNYGKRLRINIILCLFESLGHVCAMRKERKVIFLFSTFFVLDVTISFVICLCFLYLDEKAFVFSFVKKHILSKNKRDFRTFLSTYISLVPRDNPWSRDTNKPCFRTPIFR